MDATTLPTLLLGGDPQGDPADTYARVGQARSSCRPCAVSSSAAPCCTRPDGDVAAAVDIAAELVHGGEPGGTMTTSDSQCVPAERHGPARRLRRASSTTSRRRLAAHGPARRHAGRRASAASVHEPRRGSTSSCPCAVPHRSTCTDPAVRAPGRRSLGARRSSRAARTSPTCPRARSLDASPATAAGSPVAICGARAAAPRCRDEVPARRRGRGARSSCAAPAAASREVRNFGVPGVLEADSIIACEVHHPGRQLELVPAAQARRGARRGRDRARGDLLLRDRGPRPAPRRPGSRPGRLPAGLRHRRAAHRRARRGAHRRRRARAARLARPVDGRARLRPVLPERDGRARATERAWLICDDPAHAWVRETWDGQAVDPRLPARRTSR